MCVCVCVCVCYIIILDMFRAVPCSSSVGQIVLLQHLVSSLFVNDCTVRRLRADSVCSIPAYCTVESRLSLLSTGVLYSRLFYNNIYVTL